MSFLRKVVKSFQGGEWIVIYKRKGEKKFVTLKGEQGWWYADPFLLDYKDKTYLFTEAFCNKTQVGTIAYSVLENGSFTKPQVIIQNKYHMSYPDVFVYHDRVYMIPETGEARRLEMYEAEDFPYVWKRTTLKENIVWADSTVFVRDDTVYLYGYDDLGNQTDLYLLDLEKGRLDYMYGKQHDEKMHRPAGGLFCFKGHYYRPTQDCRKSYGGGLMLWQVEDYEQIGEKLIKSIAPDQIDTAYSGLHTLNISKEYVTIDVLRPEKGMKFFWRRLKRKYHRMKMEKEWNDG